MDAANGKKTVHVVAAIIWQDGRVLVQQRLPGGDRGLLWEFPGGKVEPGEDDIQALKRECHEELGAGIAVGPLASQTLHAYNDVVVALRLYHAGLVSGAEARCKQAHMLRWLWPRQLENLKFCAADTSIVADIIAGRLKRVACC